MNQLNEEEKRLDAEMQLEETRKRVSQKRRSQSTIGKMGREAKDLGRGALGMLGAIGKGLGELGDDIYGQPEPKPRRKSTKKRRPTKKVTEYYGQERPPRRRKKKKEDEERFFIDLI